MRFTTQAYLISLFYDCPIGLGIHCPTQVCHVFPYSVQESIDKMNTCIEKGWITWHAFPHVAELEIMDEYHLQLLFTRSSIQFGIHMSNQLKKRFNKEESHFISQNDVSSTPLSYLQVPGTTSAAIPILKKNGILAFHILFASNLLSFIRTTRRQCGKSAPQRSEHLPLEGPHQRSNDPQLEPSKWLWRLEMDGCNSFLTQ